MDIKWKKSKPIISFLLFFAGISLLLDSIFSLTFDIRNNGGIRQSLEAVKDYDADYQHSPEFEALISSYLECFLGMATKGPVRISYSLGGTYYSYDGTTYHSYFEDYGIGTASEKGTAVSEDTYAAESAEGVEENTYDPYDVYTWPSYYSSNPENNKKAADHMHARLKNDKNLLYRVSYDGETLYTNAEDTDLDGPSAVLPEGYNFLLYFDGTSTKIYKDGVELDVYGDGYYDEGKDWYVPGFKNFTVDDSTKKATVCLAAAESPILYINADYSSDSGSYQMNPFYDLELRLTKRYSALRSDILLLMLAVLLLAAAFFLRREKRAADWWLAEHTKKIWFEAKLLLLILIGILSVSSMSYDLNEFWWMWKEWATEGYWDAGYFSQEIFHAMSRHISSVLLLFWCHYLFVNDWYRNRKPWKHSLTEKLAGLFRAKDSQLPFQKRMLHRYLPVWIGGALLAVTALVLSVISFTEYFSYYFDTAQCVILLLLLAAVLLFSMAALTLYARKNKALSRDMGTLVSQIASVRSGNLTDSADLPEDSDLAEAMKDLNDIQQGLEIALKRQMKSEQMKVELVSNVSHDIKTPLTSIISYIDLLKQEENLPDYMKDYIQILDAKSQRLKEMVQDVFEVSKAASGQLPVQMELLDLGKLLRQTIADMAGAIDDGPVTLKTSIPSEPVMIYADGQRLYRVFQNLLQNALSYSLEGSRVFLTLKSDGTTAVASMQNTSRSELAPDVDFTERFKRGDASRTDGGSGLGLSIAKSFTEACGGAFKVETIADLFVVTVEFPQR